MRERALHGRLLLQRRLRRRVRSVRRGRSRGRLHPHHGYPPRGPPSLRLGERLCPDDLQRSRPDRLRWIRWARDHLRFGHLRRRCRRGHADVRRARRMFRRGEHPMHALRLWRRGLQVHLRQRCRLREHRRLHRRHLRPQGYGGRNLYRPAGMPIRVMRGWSVLQRRLRRTMRGLRRARRGRHLHRHRRQSARNATGLQQREHDGTLPKRPVRWRVSHDLRTSAWIGGRLFRGDVRQWRSSGHGTLRRARQLRSRAATIVHALRVRGSGLQE
jgi:hypothetical protein